MTEVPICCWRRRLQRGAVNQCRHTGSSFQLTLKWPKLHRSYITIDQQRKHVWTSDRVMAFMPAVSQGKDWKLSQTIPRPILCTWSHSNQCRSPASGSPECDSIFMIVLSRTKWYYDLDRATQTYEETSWKETRFINNTTWMATYVYEGPITRSRKWTNERNRRFMFYCVNHPC